MDSYSTKFPIRSNIHTFEFATNTNAHQYVSSNLLPENYLVLSSEINFTMTGHKGHTLEHREGIVTWVFRSVICKDEY